MAAAAQLYGTLAASNAAPFTPANASRSTVPVTSAELEAGAAAQGMPPGSAPPCGGVNPLFAAGRCLFTVDWAHAALRLTRGGAPGVWGQVAAAPLPGSDVVVSPRGGLEACSPQSCPHAETWEAAALGPLSAVSGARAAEPLATLIRVNRAPLVGEASGAWLVARGLGADALVRVDDFVR